MAVATVVAGAVVVVTDVVVVTVTVVGVAVVIVDKPTSYTWHPYSHSSISGFGRCEVPLLQLSQSS